ncbi:hypothetical protein BG011_002695 [Mortierella polycephala]|uniref:GCF C-terminal domain-containing protein n=1 Tax=Mortierella polycephala TaxID=41804 RepID=A0A9P6UAI3_9FUNG|nr:hypothetical protein BG011_002695 [Mortierella polycephala]
MVSQLFDSGSLQMFTPRKNRNIRKKVEVEDDEPATAALTVDAPATDDTEPSIKPKKPKKKVDSEDSFKVKKSAASRRLAHIKTKESSDRDQLTITSRATVGNATSYSKEALEELRRSTLSTAPSTRSNESMEGLVEEKFPTLHGGGTTIIPDANAIHLAKKKREQMRLRNDRDEEEFVSLTGGDDYSTTEQKDTRLIREEDDELDDGEADLEKIIGDKLALGNKAQKLAEKNKRAARKEMLEDMDEDEDDEEETREWEMQQIRNAGIVPKGPKADKSAPVHKTVAFPTVTQIPSLADVKKRLQGHLANLQQQHKMHTAQLSQIRREEADITLRAVEAEEAMTNASARYTFFQELRSYCRNLAAFFEEKYPELETIESEYRSLLSERTKVVVERRILDLKDDLSEFANVVDLQSTKKGQSPIQDEFGRSITADPLAAKKRRRAERERRRAQRKQSREAKQESGQGTVLVNTSTEVQDGLSTDDELGAGDERDLGEAVLDLEERRIAIFKEVGADFKSIEAVKRHFQSWKTKYPKDYNKAYGGLLLPLVFDFYVRQETCLWNPLRVSQDISEQSWHQVVSSYTIVHPSASHMHSDSESDREVDEEEDMDKDLMSKVVSKSLCPKLTQFLTAGGVDLYSARQTRCMKAILDQLLDYVDKNDNRMEQLLKATQHIILQTVQSHRDQFVEAAQPLTPHHILTTDGQVAREQYLWKTIGLFRNLMQLRRFVPASSIDTQVVDGLLHDCILRMLEGDEKDTVAKYQMIFHALPHDIRSQERHLIIDRMAQQM